MTQIIGIFLALADKIGYTGIVFLMAVESSFVPYPSEIVIPPAAYLASIGKMNFWLVVLCGIAGSLIGASINYFLARTLGRTIVYYSASHKMAKWFLINEQKIRKSEEYFLERGSISTFIGRLIPGVRQLISIPAGFARMDFKQFIFYTFLGSGVWVFILALLGYTLGSNQEILNNYFHMIKIGSIVLVLLVVIAIFGYKIFKRRVKRES
ncbi:MAG: DedA family protein [bacterium]